MCADSGTLSINKLHWLYSLFADCWLTRCSGWAAACPEIIGTNIFYEQSWSTIPICEFPHYVPGSKLHVLDFQLESVKVKSELSTHVKRYIDMIHSGQSNLLAFSLSFLRWVGTIEEFTIEQLNGYYSKYKLKQSVHYKNVNYVLQWVHHTIKYRL